MSYRDFNEKSPMKADFFRKSPWDIDFSEERVMQDIAYIQQMYPREAKEYQRKIDRILDRLDYEGSLLYDEYPDQISLHRLADNITKMIRQEEESADNAISKNEGNMALSPAENAIKKPGNVLTGTAHQPEKWEWIGKLVEILLFYEIIKRRHPSKYTASYKVQERMLMGSQKNVEDAVRKGIIRIY
ncbi:MAG: hypothetical protein ACI4DU_08495 [Lachnospiraceae bacterium]